MPKFITDISDVQEKALLVSVADIQSWLNNAVNTKLRQVTDYICREALADDTDTILTTDEKKQLLTEIANAGKLITTVENLPHDAKMFIVENARVKSAIERGAELEK